MSETPETSAAAPTSSEDARVSTESLSPDTAVDPLANAGSVPVSSPDFPTLEPSPTTAVSVPLNHFRDVSVTVTVELGCRRLPLGELLKLGPGAVVELDRDIGESVDVLAQGVRIGRGEVVVVDDHYGVRMTTLETPGGDTTNTLPRATPSVVSAEVASPPSP